MSVLKKEFQEKDVQRIRNLVKGKFGGSAMLLLTMNGKHNHIVGRKEEMGVLFVQNRLGLVALIILR